MFKQHNFLNFLDIKIKLNTIMYTPADRVWSSAHWQWKQDDSPSIYLMPLGLL